jgi:hypothetical protein
MEALALLVFEKDQSTAAVAQSLSRGCFNLRLMSIQKDDI